MSQSVDRSQAHELIERLPDSDIETAVRLLGFMLLDPVRRALATAPRDDEEVTEEDRRRFREGQAHFTQEGGGVSINDVPSEFGLTQDDFPAGQRVRAARPSRASDSPRHVGHKPGGGAEALAPQGFQNCSP